MIWAYLGPPELKPEHYRMVPDREVLLRLQNNLKSRLLQGQRFEDAARIIDTMRMLAPELPEPRTFAGVQHHQASWEGHTFLEMELADLVDKGLLEIPIAKVYSLDQVRDAFRELEKGHTHGKIVLRP